MKFKCDKCGEKFDNKIEAQLEELNNTTYSLDIEDEKVSVDKNMLKIILNWFEGLFS